MKGNKKLNNKGISLVELLIVMVVGSIVIAALIVLLTQGIKGYGKQTTASQLQNDADIALNQMTDAIMESNCLELNMKGDADGKYAYAVTTKRTSATANIYTYDRSNHILYVGKEEWDPTAATPNAGILCKNVKAFSVQVVNSSIETTPAGVVDKISDAVQVKVSLTLEYSGITRSVSRVTSIRNKIPDIKVADTMTSILSQSKSVYSDYFTE